MRCYSWSCELAVIGFFKKGMRSTATRTWLYKKPLRWIRCLKVLLLNVFLWLGWYSGVHCICLTRKSLHEQSHLLLLMETHFWCVVITVILLILAVFWQEFGNIWQ